MTVQLLSAARAGINSIVGSGSQSGLAQIIAGVGVASETLAAIAADLAELASASETVGSGSTISADIYEPVSSVVTSDSTGYSADEADWPTADGGLLDGASDYTDAEVLASSIPVGGMVPPLRLRLPVKGRGYGALPALEGEGYGFVGVAGNAARTLRQLRGAALVAAGAAGDSSAQLAVVRVAGKGVVVTTGRAAVEVKAIAATARGTATVHGSGVGTIEMKFNAAAHGQHDDEEAAIMTILLAA